MYSDAVRQMMEFVLYLHKTSITSYLKRHIEFSYNNHKFHWNGNQLDIQSGGSFIKVSVGLVKTEDRNYISALTKRLNVVNNNFNFYTFISPEMTALTKDVCVDEGSYFQYTIFGDLPDFKEIQSIFNVCNELVENNIRYFGTYRIPVFDMEKLTKKIEDQYPETKGYWGKYQ